MDIKNDTKVFAILQIVESLLSKVIQEYECRAADQHLVCVLFCCYFEKQGYPHFLGPIISCMCELLSADVVYNSADLLIGTKNITGEMHRGLKRYWPIIHTRHATAR